MQLQHLWYSFCDLEWFDMGIKSFDKKIINRHTSSFEGLKMILLAETFIFMREVKRISKVLL